MRGVIQRVKEASVVIDGKVYSNIGRGFLVLLAVEEKDTEKDMEFLLKKIPNLRVFEDENGKMNLSLKDIGGEMLVVSQFTLLGNVKRGLRPDFTRAERPDRAEKMYLQFVEKVREQGIPVKTGKFAALMEVRLINEGPVTIIIDSRFREF
ncbi:MAG: D-tyrosyl-tRNA(Tyr) deacylase [Caldiserica bacterium]|nr:MAG: D-tyrosyl-tRNA(Tyr) deacylase [Caldisericota bacterium]